MPIDYSAFYEQLIEDCIFCKMLRNEIPCFKLYEDDLTLSFMDINPINDGHALVIPKYHSENLYTTPDAWFGPTMSAARKVATAVNKVVRPEGMNLLQANGPGAKQSVFHLHIHIIPRYAEDGVGMNWKLVPGDMGSIERLAKEIKAEVK